MFKGGSVEMLVPVCARASTTVMLTYITGSVYSSGSLDVTEEIQRSRNVVTSIFRWVNMTKPISNEDILHPGCLSLV